MNKTILFLISSMMLSASDGTDIIESMKQFREEQTHNIALTHQENSAIVEQNKHYYTKISQRATAYYQDYLSNRWGNQNVKLSNISTFTQYDEDMDSRQSVDFKNGVVTIEVISDKKEKIKPQYFEKKIENLSNETVSDAIKKDPVVELEIKYMDQKDILHKKTVENNSKFMDGYIKKQLIKVEDVKQKEVILNDGKKKYISYVDVKMVPDHLKKRAIKFKPQVLKKASEYGLEPSVVFATIQTESYFNPMAKSHIPAYGLMQIVPTTAGIDAYYALTKEKKLLSPAYLFNADNNIELGSKYIQVVRDNYLRGIKDPKSLFYCAATSYNAGIGSLYYSFTGSKGKRKEAIAMINSMTPERVYNHLRTSKRLTHEARNYVKSIKERSENYKEWDKEL